MTVRRGRRSKTIRYGRFRLNTNGDRTDEAGKKPSSPTKRNPIKRIFVKRIGSAFTRFRHEFGAVGLTCWFSLSRSGCRHADKSHGRHVHRHRVRGQRHITGDARRIAAVDEQQDRHRVRKGVRVSTNMKNGYANVHTITHRYAMHARFGYVGFKPRVTYSGGIYTVVFKTSKRFPVESTG